MNLARRPSTMFYYFSSSVFCDGCMAFLGGDRSNSISTVCSLRTEAGAFRNMGRRQSWFLGFGPDTASRNTITFTFLTCSACPGGPCRCCQAFTSPSLVVFVMAIVYVRNPLPAVAHSACLRFNQKDGFPNMYSLLHKSCDEDIRERPCASHVDNCIFARA